LFSACRHFASLDAHAAEVLKGLPDGGAEAPAILEVLRAFVSEGLMISRAEMARHLSEFPPAAPPPRISWLAIPTSSRPEFLRRALGSYAAHVSRTRSLPNLLVVDDSRTADALKASKDVVDAQAANWRATVVYMGPEEKLRFIEKLTGNGKLPREIVEFGILGPTGYSPTMGANRNTILLQTAGELVLNVDDDTICDPRAVPDADPATLRLGTEGDPTEFWFFPNRESALAFVCPGEVDILGAHEALLGKQVWTLVEAPDEGRAVDLNFACAHLIEAICAGTGHVIATLNGSVGDSGMYSGRNIPLHHGAATRSRFLGSENGYRSALQGREVLRQARAAAVCHGSPFMSMFFGLDNRTIMPPFFPFGRNEDGVFGYLLERCVEDSYFGYLPWSLVHDPPPGRSYFRNAASTVRISNLLMACVSGWSFSKRHTTTSERLRSLGSHLTEVTSMTSRDFEEYIRLSLWRQAGHLIAQREALLRENGEQPDFWAADLHEENLITENALMEPDYVVPIDLPECLPRPERLRKAQEMIRCFGDLVSWWPDIVERAKEIGANTRPDRRAH
jgi:hypothetical protein